MGIATWGCISTRRSMTARALEHIKIAADDRFEREGRSFFPS